MGSVLCSLCAPSHSHHQDQASSCQAKGSPRGTSGSTPSSPPPQPVGPHSVLSSSMAPSGAWVSKSLRIRRPQPCCRSGDPQGCPCCLAPQTVLPHPGAAPCRFSTTQHLPSDWRGVSTVTSCVLPPCALWRSRRRTPPTYNWCYQLGQTQLKPTPSW